MKKTKLTSLLLATILSISVIGNFTSCNTGDNSSSYNDQQDNDAEDNDTEDNDTEDSGTKEVIKRSVKKLKLDITDATNLYIGKSSNNVSRSARAASDSVENKLFKITEDGYAQEITYTYEITNEIEYDVEYEVEYDVPTYDEEGNEIGTKKETKIETRKETKIEVETETATEIFVPEAIIPLTIKFILVCFSSDKYLVNTESGYCYKYTDDLPYTYNSLSGYYGDSVVTDSDENIYFVSNSRLLKLDITDPENVLIKTLSPKSEFVARTIWGVDKDGNIAYEGGDSSGNGVLRFKSLNGGFFNLPGNSNHSFTMFWQGLDGLMYYFNGSNPNTRVKKITTNPFSAEDYEEEMENEYQSASANMGVCGFKALLKAKNKNRTILLADGSAYPEFYEVYNPDTNKLKRIESSIIGLSKFKFGVSTDDYYYFVGTDIFEKPTIMKVDPLDYSYESLFTDGSYDVYNLSINDDSIIFNALRMRDGAIVLGKINNDKTIDILDENLEEEIKVLERIN